MAPSTGFASRGCGGLLCSDCSSEPYGDLRRTFNVQEVTPNVQAFVTLPNDVILEVQEDTALPTETAFSHFHLSVLDPNTAREWYIKTFGGVEMQRRSGVKGAGIPPGTVDFLGAGGRGGGRGKAKEGEPPAAPAPPPAPPAMALESS